jgi:hypothetical protein
MPTSDTSAEIPLTESEYVAKCLNDSVWHKEAAAMIAYGDAIDAVEYIKEAAAAQYRAFFGNESQSKSEQIRKAA